MRGERSRGPNVRIAPPLNIPRETLEIAVAEIRKVFAELDAGGAQPARMSRARADAMDAR